MYLATKRGVFILKCDFKVILIDSNIRVLDFIKLAAKKRLNAQLASQLVAFP